MENTQQTKTKGNPHIERAWAARRKNAADRRHAMWAEEMRQYGWTCIQPQNTTKPVAE
jgi:hypothetical protein